MKLIFKFGGTSLSSGQNIERVVRIVKDYVDRRDRVVVVCSAMDDVTDLLIELTREASSGDHQRIESAVSELNKMHIEAVEAVIRGREVRETIVRLINGRLEDLRRALLGVSYLREVTPRSQDYILSFGERLSTTIVWGALKDWGVDAVYLEGGDAGIVTNSNFGEALPIMEVLVREVREKVGGLLDEGRVPVITGFIGKNTEGVITTLGRGGSDYTATLIGYAINADEVWLWTDVDGLMTADPRVVKDAKVLSKVSFEEAIEMALFGAKGLHPRALEPAKQANIRVRIKNTFNPQSPGTLIGGNARQSSTCTVKGVMLVRNAGMITVRGPSMVGRPGTAAKILGVFAKENVNVMMISQSVSESSISVVVRREWVKRLKEVLEREMLTDEEVEKIEAEDDVSVVAVVGEGMKGTPGVAGKVFSAIANKKINVRMIAQGSSELNISFVVKESDALEAVRALHEEYRLRELET
ncbi:MAG: aspartate kinase [Aigarchaeota archaeon]|nr:aspartate kinase [Aigarchaeota archaeon]MDW8092925.1 aspartate kinase [Nitrososphaerota archaeon]